METGVEPLARLLGNPEAITGVGEVELIGDGSAVKSRLLAALPGRRIVHLATHGFTVPVNLENVGHDRCLQRFGWARELRPGDTTPRLALDPWRLSALVLAERNNVVVESRHKNEVPSDDAILNARDVLNLDLRGTDLVTLSACETSRGVRLSGEGALALARAFLVAGVQTVITAHWKVPATHTTDLFSRFYRRIYGPTPSPDRITALHESKHQLIKTLRQKRVPHSAFLWGAFTPMGRERR